jgi:ABC-type enterobactin transport system permease subunit
MSMIAIRHAIASGHQGDRSALARVVLVGLVGLFALAMMVSLFTGASGVSAIDAATIWLGLSGAEDVSAARAMLIINEIRLPRMVLGAMVGAGLAISGVVMQGLFRNPLADPGLVGVSAGAGLGAVLFIVLGGTILAPISAVLGIYAVPIAAFAGGALTTIILYCDDASGGDRHRRAVGRGHGHAGLYRQRRAASRPHLLGAGLAGRGQLVQGARQRSVHGGRGGRVADAVAGA